MKGGCKGEGCKGVCNQFSLNTRCFFFKWSEIAEHALVLQISTEKSVDFSMKKAWLKNTKNGDFESGWEENRPTHPPTQRRITGLRLGRGGCLDGWEGRGEERGGWEVVRKREEVEERGRSWEGWRINRL